MTRRFAFTFAVAVAMGALTTAGCPSDQGSSVKEKAKQKAKSLLSKKPIEEDGYVFGFEGEQASRKREGKVAPTVEKVVIVNKFGPVKVEGTEGPFTWSWEVRAWAKGAERAEQIVKEEIKLEAKTSGTTLRLETKLPKPSPGLKGVEATLRLKVPAAISLDLKSGHGAAAVTGITGSVTVSARHSNVTLEELKDGPLKAKTSFGTLTASKIPGGRLTNQQGAIRVDEARGDLTVINKKGEVVVKGVRGDLKVENEHGELKVTGVEGEAELRTSHAKLSAEGVDKGCVLENAHGPVQGRKLGGAVKVKSQHGKVELRSAMATQVTCRVEHGEVQLDLSSPRLSRVEASTSNAPLSLTLPYAIRGTFSLSSTNGTIHAPATAKVVKVGSRSEAKWKNSDSTARVTLENENGDVTVNRPTDR